MTNLEQMKKLVEFLGIVLGEHCEVVLQDISEDRREIVAIANGGISGRKIGAPLTGFALGVLADESWKTEDYRCNYPGLTKDNRQLRSSTFYIKENGKLVGMLCINADTSEYRQLSEAILKLGGALPQDEPQGSRQEYPEKFSESIADITYHTIQATMEKNGDIPADHMTQEERLSIVRYLNERVVFLLKGAVSEVAKQLACSEASVYRYLSIIAKQSKEAPEIERKQAQLSHGL